jgi:hypothetical protein
MGLLDDDPGATEVVVAGAGLVPLDVRFGIDEEVYRTGW